MRNFKFFHGYINIRAVWEPVNNEIDHFGLDAEEALTRLLSNEIAREIDDNIIEELTRRINGMEPPIFEGRIGRFSDNIDYLNHYLSIGGQRA